MKPWIILIVLGLLNGCASMLGSVTGRLADDLAATILDSDDPETIREGIPAYLILIDSLLRKEPRGEGMLIAASRLNGAFVNLVDDPVRDARYADKSLAYARDAACVHASSFCDLQTVGIETFRARIAGQRTADVEVAYSLATAWLGWIQAHSGDWNAIAELARPRSLLERILELREDYDSGGVHFYLGVLDTLLPAAMGGRPESGREHFERSIELSGERYLMTKVMYARQYARLQFDKDLHDRLLREVLAADPHVAGMTLANVLAQREARTLLAESDEYF